MYTRIRKSAFTDERLEKLAEAMASDRIRAMGTLTWLWFGSQSAMKTHATAEEIRAWLMCADRQDPIVDALERSGYLEYHNGTYRIRGNSGPVGRLLRAAERREAKRGRRAATARPKGTRSASTAVDNAPVVPDELKTMSVEDATRVVEATVEALQPDPSTSSVLEDKSNVGVETPVKRKTRRKASAVTSKACDDDPEKKARGAARKKGGDVSLDEQRRRMPGTFVWTAYKRAFQERYGVEPVRNAKVNAQCQQLAKEVGVDVAEQVAAYYLQRNDAFYVNAKHPIGLCVTNAQKLVVEMRTGDEVNMTEARRLEKQGSTRKAIQTYMREQGGQQ